MEIIQNYDLQREQGNMFLLKAFCLQATHDTQLLFNCLINHHTPLQNTYRDTIFNFTFSILSQTSPQAEYYLHVDYFIK